MANIYGSTPTFTDGQVLSASAHLNALQSYVQSLSDDFMGPAVPFCGSRGLQDYEYSYEWIGAIRHKYDKFSYNYRIDSGAGSVSITIDGKLVPGSTHSGAGTYSASNVDISSLNLVNNNFYTVRVTASNDSTRFTVWYLSEKRTPSSPTMIAFADDQTPTAAQWQGLSYYADELALRMLHPVAAVATIKELPVGVGEDYSGPAVGRFAFIGTFNHRCRYLAYSLRVISPYWGEDSIHDDPLEPDPEEPYDNIGARYTEVRIYVGTDLAAKFSVGSTVRVADDAEYFEHVSVPAGGEHTFTGELDLEAYPPGVITNYGVDSQVYIEMTTSTVWDVTASCFVNYFYEVPDEDETLSPWAAFDEWEHGYFAFGSTGDPKVQQLRGNLANLGALLTYHNYPARMISNQAIQGELYNSRRWRFLHHRSVAEDKSPTLKYMSQGEEKTVSLENAYSQWLAFDLDSVEDLYPGTVYSLQHTYYAMEDLEP